MEIIVGRSHKPLNVRDADLRESMAAKRQNP